MPERQTALLTADDYRALPENGPRYQLIQGELFMAPAPSRYHQDISRNIEFILLQYLAARPIGKLYHAPFDVYLGEHDVYQPDIFFVANDRRDTLCRDGAHGAPTLVIEILSPSNSRLDEVQKKAVYAAAGVIELWLVDSDAKTVSIFHLRKDAFRAVRVWRESDTFESQIFPGLQLEGRAIFNE